MIGKHGANTIRSNLWKLLFLQTMNWFLLIMPTLVLFFNENGMTLSQVMILQAIFSISLFAFEVPSGYFSDVVGRRFTLVISTILNTIGLLLMSLSSTFTGFMAAELLLGISASFVSGTDSALLYDTLESLERTQEYTKYQGILSSIGNFSETLAAIIGGWLAALSLRLPLYVETAVVALTIPVALMLIEPDRKPRHRRAGLADIIQIAKFSLAEHKLLKGFITYSSFIGAATFTVVWLIQPAVAEAGLPIYWFGFLWAGLNFSVGAFSLAAHKVEQRIGSSATLFMLPLLIGAGYGLAAATHSLWLIAVFFIFYFVRGIHGPVLTHYINQIISSENRATILSIRALLTRLIFVIVGPLIGRLKDLYSFRVAFMAAGVIFTVGGFISLRCLRKYQRDAGDQKSGD